MSEQSSTLSFDINGIKQCQRNRHPVLLIDKVVDVVAGKRARGIKCFSYNEWYFPGHFDDEPNVPGFIQIECLVQTFIMTFLCLDEYKGKKTNFASIDKVKFRRKIIPGETLVMDAELKSFKRGLAVGSVSSAVNGEPACSAEFMVTVPDEFSAFKPK